MTAFTNSTSKNDKLYLIKTVRAVFENITQSRHYEEWRPKNDILKSKIANFWWL